jgi:hypothetical protein
MAEGLAIAVLVGTGKNLAERTRGTRGCTVAGLGLEGRGISEHVVVVMKAKVVHGGLQDKVGLGE